jgi:hypothetical protein
MKKTQLIFVLAVIVAASGSVFAGDVPTEKKADFRKLVLQRNKFHKELQAKDKQAAELVKQNKDATKINSKQVTIQDSLDLNQLRLETMAARYELDIPELPVLNAQGEVKGSKGVYGADAFQRGRTRTMLEIKRQTFLLLKSLDYSIIISKLKEN